MKKELLKKVIANISFYLSGEEIVIGGSVALELMGMNMPERKKGKQDLDLVIVNPKESTLNLLKKAMILMPAETKPIEGYGETSSLIAILSLIIDGNNIKVDIFKEDSNYELSDVKFEGFKLASVKSILKAKKSYKRVKDEEDLRHYSEQFFDYKAYLKDRLYEILFKQ